MVQATLMRLPTELNHRIQTPTVMDSVMASTLLLVFVSLDQIHIQTTRICQSIPMVMDCQTTILAGPGHLTLTMTMTTMDSQMCLKNHAVPTHSMPTASLLTWTVTPSVTMQTMTRTVTELTTSTKRATLVCLLAVHQSTLIPMVTEFVTDLNLQ